MLSNHFHIRHSLVKFLLFLTVLAGATTALAISVATYRDRVHLSLTKLESLRTRVINDEANVSEYEVLVFEEVRRLLPPTETVEVNGSSMRVDNSWLDAKLKLYENRSSSSEDRKRLLTEVIEQLTSLDNALAETVKSESSKASPTNKDQERSNLSSILRRDEYAKKADEGNALTRLWQRFVAWVRNLFPKAPQIEPGRAKFFSQLAQVVVVILALAIIAFVAWKFWPRIWKLNPKSKSGKREVRVVLGERLEPNQTSADLMAEAEKLARDGQLRAAIRKGYIAFLCELGDRKILGLAVHKTNRDYLRSVRGHQQLHSEMQFLTKSFESHWYGFASASIEDWNLFLVRYRQALRQG